MGFRIQRRILVDTCMPTPRPNYVCLPVGDTSSAALGNSPSGGGHYRDGPQCSDRRRVWVWSCVFQGQLLGLLLVQYFDRCVVGRWGMQSKMGHEGYPTFGMPFKLEICCVGSPYEKPLVSDGRLALLTGRSCLSYYLAYGPVLPLMLPGQHQGKTGP
jgi:hypothetical protein